jgi:hypothetical protein|tara:strand:+ start:121 stop:444 length:324 start_codon:yes stop_codon:yes gene_type:complete
MKKKVNLKAEQIDNQSKIAEFVKAIEENKILNAKIRINKALLEDAKALLDLHDSIEGDNLNITMTSSIVAEHIVTEHTRKTLKVNRFSPELQEMGRLIKTFPTKVTV